MTQAHECVQVSAQNSRSQANSAVAETAEQALLPSPRNQLLSDLPKEEYSRLAPKLELVLLRRNEILYYCGRTISHVFFPDYSVISVLNCMEDGSSVNLAVVGRQGCLGISLALGDRTSSHLAIVQVPGTALRMKADDFLNEFYLHATFQNRLLGYIRRHLSIISQSAACNRLHPLRKRLACLLLTLGNETDSAQFAITHEDLSAMLGASRPEVSKAASALRSGGLIQYSRDKIKIGDRKSLESAACECYSLIAKETSRALPMRKRESAATRPSVVRRPMLWARFAPLPA